jgi:hypothetical protein
MKLSTLIAGLDVTVPAAVDPVIWNLAEDSRKVRQGACFFARVGTKADGRAFIADAIARGAVAVIAPKGSPAPEGMPATVAWVEAADPALAAALIAERFHGSPSRTLELVGVTGTNGKTTIAYLVQQLLAASGLRTGLVGTVEIDAPLTVDTDMDVTGTATVFNGLTVQGSQLSVTGVGSSVDFSANLTMAGGNDIIGTAGSTLSSFSSVAASILDATSTGETRTQTLAFYQDTTPSNASGKVAWDGYKVTLGDGVAARAFAIPLISYVASVSTASGIDDTGASITIDMLTGQTVSVLYESEVTNSTAGLTIALRIEANGSTIGGSASRRVAAGATGEYQSFTRRVPFTAASDGAVTFKARHGASAGSTTSTNVNLTVTRT